MTGLSWPRVAEIAVGVAGGLFLAYAAYLLFVFLSSFATGRVL